MRWVGWAALLASQHVGRCPDGNSFAQQRRIMLEPRLSGGRPIDQSVTPIVQCCRAPIFQAVFWSVYRVRNAAACQVKRVRLILLAGLTAEGVLVGF